MGVPKPPAVKAGCSLMEPPLFLTADQRVGLVTGHVGRWRWGLKQLVIEPQSPHSSRGVGEDVPLSVVLMQKFDHGDLVEQRRGDVDAMRVMVATLGAHHQSGAINLRSSEQATQGWLIVRLGQPVMASMGDEYGLEALLSIEQLGLRSTCDLFLYELTAAQMRGLLQQHPEAVLDVALSAKNGDDAWWANASLPITGWRKTASLDELEELSIRTDTRPRTKHAPRQQERLLRPGGVYIHDSPDPHPVLELGVELAAKGMPLLGLFALPFAETEATRQLPAPSCFALFRSIVDLKTLSSVEEMIDELQRFLWESDRSVVLLNGLDRIGNALGDEAMMAFYRLVVDHVQLGDHALLCTTDLGIFDAMTQHKLQGEAELLMQRDIDAWLAEADVLLDHPLLVPDDDDELMWMEAHLDHHANHSAGAHKGGWSNLEGGSVEVDEDTRLEATSALKGLVDSWPVPEATNPAVVEAAQATSPLVGATPWQASTPELIRPSRKLSEIPVHDLEEPSAVQTSPSRRPRATFVQPKAPRGPRRPQRMKARKPSPQLPKIEPRNKTAFASSSQSDEATFEAIRGRRSSFDQAGLADAAERMDRSLNSFQSSASGGQRELRDAARNTAPIESSRAPVRNTKTLYLPKADDAMLKGPRQGAGPVPSRRSRESSKREQHTDDMDALHREWVSRKERSQFRSTALYDEKGRPLHRFGSDRS